MKNIEKYADLIEKTAKEKYCNDYSIAICHVFSEVKKVDEGTFGEALKWLFEEYKEPIKLTRFEFDLIDTNNQSHDRTFESYATYKNMMGRGHFKNVNNVGLTLKQILENCEIVEVEHDQ